MKLAEEKRVREIVYEMLQLAGLVEWMEPETLAQMDTEAFRLFCARGRKGRIKRQP